MSFLNKPLTLGTGLAAAGVLACLVLGLLVARTAADRSAAAKEAEYDADAHAEPVHVAREEWAEQQRNRQAEQNLVGGVH